MDQGFQLDVRRKRCLGGARGVRVGDRVYTLVADGVFSLIPQIIDPSLSVSFRPRLPPLGHRRSSSSSSSESSHAPKETPAARIRRLKAELAEVEQEIQAGPSSASTTSAPQDEAPSKRKSVLPPRPPVDLLSELTGLRNRLESINIDDIPRRSDTVDHGSSEAWKARIRNISASAEENGTKPGGNGDQERRSNTGEAPGLTDLDKRLASLEQLIGPSEASLEAVSPHFSMTTIVLLTTPSSRTLRRLSLP
jgi:nuclear migration protein JNM1